jgi:hypothetical protein
MAIAREVTDLVENVHCRLRLSEWIDKDMFRRAHCTSDPFVKTRAKRRDHRYHNAHP